MIYIDYLYEKLIDTEDYFAKGIGMLSGYLTMLYFMTEVPLMNLLFSWIGVLNTLVVLATSMGSTVVVLFGTDVYKWCKKGTLKYFKSLVILKPKRLRRNVKKSNNNKVA